MKTDTPNTEALKHTLQAQETMVSYVIPSPTDKSLMIHLTAIAHI